jgi:hypothetical protein
MSPKQKFHQNWNVTKKILGLSSYFVRTIIVWHWLPCPFLCYFGTYKQAMVQWTTYVLLFGLGLVKKKILGGPILIEKGEKKNDQTQEYPWLQYVFSKHRPSGPMLSIIWNVRLSVCPSVHLFVRLSVCSLLRYRLNVFLPPQRMSKIFRDSESLGKSNGKKWSQIWTFLFESCLKSPRKKNCFFGDFALQNMVETTLPDG